MKQRLMDELRKFPAFVKSLESIGDETWFEPLGEGKWSIHDIVAHIMKWDEYFNQVTFPSLTPSERPELNEHPDYLGYNEQSVRYGRTRTRAQIVEETLRNRQLLMENLDRLEEDKFLAVYPGARQFTLESYLRAFFSSHDRHHMKQIQDFLEKRGM